MNENKNRYLSIEKSHRNTNNEQIVSNRSSLSSRGCDRILHLTNLFRTKVVRIVDDIIISDIGRLIPMSVFAISLGFSIHYWNTEYQSMIQSIANQLEKQLLEVEYPIQGRIQAYQQILYGIHGLFDSSHSVTREDFGAYIQALNIAKNFPEIPGISVSFQVLDTNSRERMEEIESLIPLTNTGKGQAPVVYFQPHSPKNLKVPGFDNFTDPTHKESMQSAQIDFTAKLSDPIHLLQESGTTTSSFIIFYPLYKRGFPHNTYSERIGNILGWSAVAFPLSDLISEVSGGHSSDIDLRIYDGQNEDSKMLLYDSLSGVKKSLISSGRETSVDFSGEISSELGKELSISSSGETSAATKIKFKKIVHILNRDLTFVMHSTDSTEKLVKHQRYLDSMVRMWILITFMLTFTSWYLMQKRRESLVIIDNLNQTLGKNSYMATHDALTNLPNRILLLDRLKVAFSNADRNGNYIALMFIDLDNFKTVNDSIGHIIGDELLKQVAVRMRDCIRSEDTVARQGGDEFMIILSDLVAPQDAAKVAIIINTVLATPFIIDGNEIHIGSSIGIATYPSDTSDIDTLQKFADVAMYDVKGSGGNGYQFYSLGMQEISEEQQLLATALHHAVEREELSVFFQPIVDVVTGKIASMEALLRWNHPELGNISPSKFIPIAESTGLIVPIGNWTIRTVCQQIQSWEKQGISVPKIAINLSIRQLRSKNFISNFNEIIHDTQIAPEKIGIEITESMLIDDAESDILTINAFAENGFEVSIDDFGTGYSSLSYLRKFKIGKIKIDRSFILDIDTVAGAHIVQGIIALAHSIGMEVVAEGIENIDQYNKLNEIGCDYIQGYYFGRPENAEKTFQKLVSNTRFD